MKAQQFPVVEEYKKHPENTPRDVARLREWAATQPHLPATHLTDLDLILIYHCLDYSFEGSKQLLDTQYSLRTQFNCVFHDRQWDEKIELALNTVLMTLLPTRSPEGYACLYIRFLDNTVKNMVTPDIVKASMMLMDLWQYEEGSWPGLKVIVDLYGLGISHTSRFHLQSLQQFFRFLQEGIPLKLKNMHFVNCPSYIDTMFSLLRPLMSSKVQEMLRFHPVGSDTIFKFYPKEGFPKEDGGQYKTYAECRDEVISKLKENFDFFAEEKKKRVTESLRPEKPNTYNNTFGVSSFLMRFNSFRKKT